MVTTTSWEKGQSGNLQGRPPKGESITELIKEHLQTKPVGESLTYKELFVKRLVDMAVLDCYFPAMRLILYYENEFNLSSKLINFKTGENVEKTINVVVQDYLSEDPKMLQKSL